MRPSSVGKPPPTKPDARITDIVESLADAEQCVRGGVSSFGEARDYSPAPSSFIGLAFRALGRTLY
jgi:hypothetical protein